jgi:hypothetical protein
MHAARAKQILTQLASTGLPPRDITAASEDLPMFSVGIDDWIDRLATEYLGELCRSQSHFKLVLAPYGGGKTHFLMALGIRALQENYAVSYIACVPGKRGSGARVDDPMGLYSEVVGQLQLPSGLGKGVPALLNVVVDRTRKRIEESGASDPDRAFELFRRQLRVRFPGGQFGDFAHVMSIALHGVWSEQDDSIAFRGAEKWLDGRLDSLTKDEWAAIGLRKPTVAQTSDLGRRQLLAIANFLDYASVFGLVLLIDEVETMFNAKGKALQSVLGAIRTMTDWSGSGQITAPMLGIFAAVPDVEFELRRYPAVQQRYKVMGASFEEGNDSAPVINLEKVRQDQPALLQEIGVKLVELALVASGSQLNRDEQLDNAKRLAQIASKMNLDIDSRRLFVKACSAILQLQISTGAKTFPDKELAERYRGEFDGMRIIEKQEFEG